MRVNFTILIMSSLLLLGVNAWAKPPENLTVTKQKLQQYYDSGQYAKDVDAVFKQAKEYLAERIKQNQQTGDKKRLAIVMGVDETALSNYASVKKGHFANVSQELQKSIQHGKGMPIKAALSFYRYAVANSVAIFFVTSRDESLRSVTMQNLQAAGYDMFQGLYMKPNDYQGKTMAAYKTGARKAIESQGYDIVLTINDQVSDLQGGYADKAFKLPNPYYQIP